MLDEKEDQLRVLSAAAEIVHAFGAHDKQAYFDCFAPEATFIFYNCPRRLESREEYQWLWDEWEHHDYFRVRSCESSDQRVTMFGAVAVFTHTVRTKTVSVHGETTSKERETIIFSKAGDRWIAVHEHLSELPKQE